MVKKTGTKKKQKTKSKKGGCRKSASSQYTEYQPGFCEVLKTLAEGNTEFYGTVYQICTLLNCSTQSYYNWRNEHPEFAEAVKYALFIGSQNCLKSLYERANGISKTVTKRVITRPDGSIQSENIIVTNPPDTQALKFILTNRDPDNWKEKMDVKQTGNLVITFEEQDAGFL
ncbi:MAG: hypothetical protein WC936_06730 [Candidatus Nanoarchaeia archaeon]